MAATVASSLQIVAATVASSLQIVAARPCLSFSPAAAIQGSNSKRLSWAKPTSSCNISSLRNFTSPAVKFNKLVTKAVSESSENKPVYGLPIDLKDKFSCCFLAFVADITDDHGYGWAMVKTLTAAGAEILVGTWLPIKANKRYVGSSKWTVQLNPKMSNYTVESSTVETSDGVDLRTRIFKAKQDMKDDNNNNMVIVLVHPYSIMGGCQALMKGIASGLAEKGFSAVTFDMRGVGRSTGKPSLTGFPEVADVVSVCNWVSQNLSSERILLLGSSAGAPIAGSAVDQIEQVVGYVSLGYPFGMMASILFGRHHKAILQSPKPKLFVMGTEDGFTSVSQLNNKLKSAAGQNITRLLEGVSHFEMEGPDYDAEMVNCILEFISSL